MVVIVADWLMWEVAGIERYNDGRVMKVSIVIGDVV